MKNAEVRISPLLGQDPLGALSAPLRASGLSSGAYVQPLRQKLTAAFHAVATSMASKEWMEAGAGPTAPVTAILRILARWDIDDASGAIILGSDEANLVSDLRTRHSTLTSRDMQDRARLLLDIYEGVYALSRNQDAERAWIRLSRDDLGHQSLLDLMTEGSQRNLIRAQAFVDHVNGR
jgi:hypothetical protein